MALDWAAFRSTPPTAQNLNRAFGVSDPRTPATLENWYPQYMQPGGVGAYVAGGQNLGPLLQQIGILNQAGAKPIRNDQTLADYFGALGIDPGALSQVFAATGVNLPAGAASAPTGTVGGSTRLLEGQALGSDGKPYNIGIGGLGGLGGR